ncbi:unnamed protein product [Prorocentrum cordatum]|uniref:K Homology domain-containing protein n=1 Tax=Prorocentrum cordatum TaxID=2364126 RepID=A0ABN9PV77_9DINO|nr:unnamed protein product [Polarella glacialis]
MGRWGLGAPADVPDWRRDQFQAPEAPPMPRIGPGQRNVKVPQQCVGKILGKMGASVNEMQAQTRCDIKMNQDTKEHGYSFAVITSVEDLDACEKLILDLLCLVVGVAGELRSALASLRPATPRAWASSTRRSSGPSRC